MVFYVPVLDRVLLYAPLHHVAALLNRHAAVALRDSLLNDVSPETSALGEIAELLSTPPQHIPAPRRGGFTPTALGLLPTRGCNLNCRYCGFLSPVEGQNRMSLELTAKAVNWYFDEIAQSETQYAEVHFFGGEPFCVEEVVDLAVNLAKHRAAEIGCEVRFEVATNGTFSPERCRWISDNLDTIVLSFDGPPDIQNHQRPYKNGDGSFEVVARNARQLSEGDADLFLRACVTAQTVARMPEIAAWFCADFRPSAVSFEPLQPTQWSENADLHPPDPWEFARFYHQAARILEMHGVCPIYAPAEIGARQVTFCPVGKDFVIVSPDGRLAACYLLQRDWEDQGLDLHLGFMDSVAGQAPQIDQAAIQRVRRLNVNNKALCATCFAKWHCAGGCHVNHQVQGEYDRLCLQTRIIALCNILKALDHEDLVDTLLNDQAALEHAIRQPSDLLQDLELVS